MITSISSQPPATTRPEDNEPKNDRPQDAASVAPTNTDAVSSSTGLQPTPGGTNVIATA